MTTFGFVPILKLGMVGTVDILLITSVLEMLL